MGETADAVRAAFGPSVHPRRLALDVAAHHLRGEPVPAVEAIGATFEPFAVGDSWGGMWDTTWFRLSGSVPADWAGEQVAIMVHLGGDETEDMVGFSAEGLIYDPAGRALQGVHHRHRLYTVTSSAQGGEPVELYVEAAANPRVKWHSKVWPLLMPDYQGPALYVLGQAELVTVNPEALALYHDAVVVAEMADSLPSRADEAKAAVDEAVSRYDAADPKSAASARQVLRDVLAAGSDQEHRMTAIGHAHIDSAWLWPVRETRRKCARTFANQLRLMEAHPEHLFACSQAVQYEWIKQDHPDLYEQIKERVAEGRWIPLGGMWVEPDCNIPSGESLVRQLVHGKRFFLDEFGVETHELWIPDVFGYTAALPQIAAAAGVDALITQKMSWNDTNVFPHSTFWWEGHDGSRVLAHFPPANTYNGDFSVGELARSQENFRDHQASDQSLYLYGYGDGGGGPTDAMLQSARRLANVAGLPAVAIGAAADFLASVRAEGSGLDTWVGELYLEFHRGTFTTHADVKLGNRRVEEALRAAEMWSVAAGIDRRDELDQAWKLLLLSQFHDILPGSSIHWVYDDAVQDHADAMAAANSVIDDSTMVLTQAGPDGLTVFNPSSYDRTEVIDLPDGTPALVQAQACSWSPLVVKDRPTAVRISDNWIDNAILRLTWNDRGLVTSIWDHQAQREVVAPGALANLFQIHEDNPASFDAWNVDRDYLDHRSDIEDLDELEIVEDLGIRGGIRMVRSFGDSRIDQVVRLAAGSRRLEFQTRVDWHERHRFLKVAFPVDIRSTRATYEIQHGYLERPTAENTSWDKARFEVTAQRWADLSEPGYGVALLNNCKYGYDIRSNVMRLSLLRAPGYPDPEADQGHHRFVYALVPHQGDLRRGNVVEEAEAFNLPLKLVPGRGAGQVVSVDRPGVSVEAVKWADRRDGVVVRLCEVYGSRGPVRVTVGAPFESVTRTDILERDIEPVAHTGRSVEIQVRPFELVTLFFSGWRPTPG